MVPFDPIRMSRIQGKHPTVCIQLVGRDCVLQLPQNPAANRWPAEVKLISMKLTFLNQSAKDS